MKDELTNAELEEIFYGKRPVVVAEFYETDVLDTQASREAGQRIMKKRDYVHLSCEKENVEISRPATDLDRTDYPREWQEFVAKRNGNGSAREVQDIRTERPAIGAGVGAYQGS